MMILRARGAATAAAAGRRGWQEAVRLLSIRREAAQAAAAAVHTHKFSEPYLQPCAANNEQLTPVSYLDRTAELFGGETAIIYDALGLRMTYAQMHLRCRKLASTLVREFGVGPGDVVSIMSPNTPAMAEAHFAVPGSGAVLHTINTRLTPADVAFQLEHAETRVLLCDVECLAVAVQALELMEGAHRPALIEIADASFTRDAALGSVDGTYQDLVDAGDAKFTLRRPHSEHDAIAVSYTSGTTGSPKGVVTHHRGAFLTASAWQQTLNMHVRPTMLWVVPMFHCNGWCFPWTMAMQAGTNVCQRHVQAESLLKAMTNHKITHMGGAPVVMNMLLNAPEALKAPVRAKHMAANTTNGGAGVTMVVGGAPPPPSQIRAFREDLGINVRTAYGLTESYGPATSFVSLGAGVQPSDEQLIWQAQLPCLAEARVVDPDTMQPVPADGATIGEVVIRGSTVMSGYLKSERATLESFEGGWFHTGDLAVAHPNGRFEIKDRAKDVIVSGGENVASVEVETALHTHPAVEGVACVAIPDDYYGECVCAVVETTPQAPPSPQLAADMIAHARMLLAPYKAPRVVLFRPLPRTATGKIQKHQLRALLRGQGVTGPGKPNKAV